MQQKPLVFQVGIICRHKGTCRSAVDAAAYILGEKWKSEYDGQTYDHSDKAGEVVYTKMVAPDGLPACATQPYTLMHAIEWSESRSNAQLVRTMYFSLPPELTLQQQMELLDEFVERAFVKAGMIALYAIHHTEGNPNAHMVLTMRRMLPDGSFLPKSKDIPVVDEKGQPVLDKNGKQKTRKVNLTEWNDMGNGELWRKACALQINKCYKLAGLDIQVDHRSPKRQGLCQLSPAYMNPAEHEAEQRGERTEVGELNCWIQEENHRRANDESRKQAINKLVEAYTAKIKQLARRESYQSPRQRATRQLFRDLHALEAQFKTGAGATPPPAPPEQSSRVAEARQSQKTHERGPHVGMG